MVRRFLKTPVALAIALGLEALMASPSLAQDGWPREISHAFGTTVLEQKPKRIATVNWSNHEVPLALGVVPVGFAAAAFGDDDGDGVLPWVETRLAELGAETPVLFDEGDGIDFEAVAATEPDVILAAYSGLSASDYEMLSRIAPVIAYPEAPWSTDWRETILMNAAGMGMAEEGQVLIAEMEAKLAETRAKHPELAGKSAMFVTHLSAVDLSRIGFYTDNDTRVRFFHDLGLTSPALVVEAAKDGAFAGQISAERIDEIAEVDLLVTYGDAQLRDQILANPLTSRLPAIARGSFVMLGNTPLGTAANPTPLSLPYLLDEYAQMLGDAVTAGQ